MARDSRPPGFDMTYRPTGRQAFGPPVGTWIFPLIYLATSVGAVAFVILGHVSSSSSWAFRYVVEQDAQRVVSAQVLALIFLGGAIAAVIRTAMRGVVVHPDGIEARYVVSLGWPKVKNISWVEIDKLVCSERQVWLQLWDGSGTFLPPVRDANGLSDMLERIAAARAIPVKGGQGRFTKEDVAEE